MQTIAIIGPLGSGKTTLVNAVLAFLSNLRVLVVVNDVGTENIDASRIKNTGDIKALTAGCIGCSDLPAFQQVIREAQQTADSIDVLLIEPTGIADGKEIRDAVVGAGEKFHAITLVDVKHFSRNRALGCMENQLEVSSVVGLTWNTETTPEVVLEFIGKHAMGRPVFQNAFGSISELVELALKDKPRTYSMAAPKCGCGHDHHHGDHAHIHSHDHGVYSFSFKLLENATHEDLVSVLAPQLPYLVRAKGVIDGRLFDFVQGDLSLGEVSSNHPHGNFIFNKPVEGKIVLEQIILPAEEDIRTKKERMRHADVPLADTLAAIQWQLGEYPSVVTPSGELRVDCEADVVYQLAKRNGVSEEIRQEVMGKYLSWRLEATKQLQSGSCEGNPQIPYWKRRLGINLGYMCAMYPDLIGETLAEQIQEVRPADTLAEGLLGLNELSFDEEMAEEKPETVARAFSFGQSDSVLTGRAIRHCVHLSENNPAWHTRWMQL